MAPIDPAFTLGLAAIADSGPIAPIAVLDSIQEGTNLARAVHDLGPTAVDAAPARAAAMSYDDALQHVFDNIDRLIAATA